MGSASAFGVASPAIIARRSPAFWHDRRRGRPRDAPSFVAFENGKSGLSDAYLNWLWQPEAFSQKARRDPAFEGFAKRIGMVDYWKQYGWPDLCKPAPEQGPDAFVCQ